MSVHLGACPPPPHTKKLATLLLPAFAHQESGQMKMADSVPPPHSLHEIAATEWNKYSDCESIFHIVSVDHGVPDPIPRIPGSPLLEKKKIRCSFWTGKCYRYLSFMYMLQACIFASTCRTDFIFGVFDDPESARTVNPMSSTKTGSLILKRIACT